jgi:hypothetical protein
MQLRLIAGGVLKYGGGSSFLVFKGRGLPNICTQGVGGQDQIVQL